MKLYWKKIGILDSRSLSWSILIWVVTMANVCEFVGIQAQEGGQATLSVTDHEQHDPQSMFQAGVKMFEDGFYHQAQEVFEEWIETFPDHELQEKVAEYALWAKGEHAILDFDYSQASEFFSQLLRDYPESNHRLGFAFGEAWSRFYLQQYGRVAELLTNEKAPYTQAALRTEITGDPRATTLRLKGKLLLADTWLKMEEFARTKAVLDGIPDWSLSDELVWRREFLLTQLLLKEGDLLEARQSASRLLAWARSIESVEWIAESVALKGDVLRANGQFDAALETYQENLADFIPEMRRREARLKMIELNILNEEIGTVLDMLSSMLGQQTTDASLDIVLLTLGELNLKQYYGKLQPPESNLPTSPGDLLMNARRHIDTLIKNHPISIYRSRAFYALGWCLWELGEYPQSLDAFRQASDGLEKSIEHAECIFKQGDIRLKTGDAKGALEHYRRLLSEYENYQDVSEQLFDQALYQMLRAAILADHLEDASAAAKKIIDLYPNGPIAQRSRLLLGQRLVHVDRVSEARAIFEDMVAQFGQFPLRAEVDLALAHAYEQEGAWASALNAYQHWLETYTDNDERARTEYALAWVHDRLGNDVRALALFQQFVRVHDQHEFVPLAQNWIADYFFNLGRFEEAEIAYGKIANPLSQSTQKQKYQAILMMAKCQFHMGDYAKVIDYLKPFENEFKDSESVDKDFAAEVFLCMGDASFAYARQATPGSLESADRAKAATNAYIAVYASYIPNRWEPEVWGRVGDLNYYLGEDYPEAVNSYKRALAYKDISISMRSQLEYSLGQVKERMAETLPGRERKQLNEDALKHYLNIVYLKNLKRGENPDAYWIRKAGVKVMEMLERTRNWAQAKTFSEYLTELMPAQKDEWLRMMIQWNQRLPVESSPNP